MVGVQKTFLLLGAAFILALPPVLWLFLRQLRRDRHQPESRPFKTASSPDQK
jgi:hypothetical protein